MPITVKGLEALGVLRLDPQWGTVDWLSTIEAVVRDAARTIWPQGESTILARYGLTEKEMEDAC